MEYRSFISGSNRSQSPIADNQRTVNWYSEPSQVPGANTAAALYPSPGLETFITVDEGPARGTFVQQGRCFAVIGFTFYEVFADGSVTDYGDVAADDNPATMCSNGDAGHQVFVASGTIGYIFDLDANTLTAVTTGITACGFVDGYFVALDAITSTFKISDLEDGTTWDPAQVAQRQTAADRWVGMIVKNREVWLFGSLTSDVWVNVGTSPFPFAPIETGLIQHGAAAGFSAAVALDTVLWLEASTQGAGMVMQSEGYLGKKVSTYAVDFALQGYDSLADAVGYTYQDQGHVFYVLNLPNAQATWVYDLTTGMWHERLFWNVMTGRYEAHHGICHAFAFGKHLIGDRTLGVVYEQSIDIATDADGAPLRRLRRAPHLSSENKETFYHKFELDMETGLGLARGDADDPDVLGSDPQIRLRFSNNGGKTWGTELACGAGRIGEYDTRVIWRRLGHGRDRIFEVIASDPVPWRLMQAWLDATLGTS